MAGSNAEATPQQFEGQHDMEPQLGTRRSVWYRWVAPASGEFQIDTCTSDFDTVISVYTGDVPDPTVDTFDLNPVARADDAPGCGTSDEGVSRGTRLRFNTLSGTTYYIAVDGYVGVDEQDTENPPAASTYAWETGNFTINLGPPSGAPGDPGSPPPNAASKLYRVQASTSTYDEPGFPDANFFAVASGTTDDVPGPLRVVVLRGGSKVREVTGDYSTFETSPGNTGATSVADAGDFAVLPGDVIQLFEPASATSPTRFFTVSARPTLTSCPVGQNRLFGALDSGTTVVSAGGTRPSDPGGTPTRSNRSRVTTTDSDFAAALKYTLHEGDIVRATVEQLVAGDLTFTRSLSALAGTCGVVPPSQPSGGGGDPPAGGGQPGPSPSLLDGLLSPLSSRALKQGSNPGVVSVRVTCPGSSTIPCAGSVTIQTTKAFATAKGRKVVLAKKRFSAAAGKTQTVKLKLTPSGVRLLKRQHKLRVKVTATTKLVTGKSSSRSRLFTLKAPRAR
jgi:hypothetical protein